MTAMEAATLVNWCVVNPKAMWHQTPKAIAWSVIEAERQLTIRWWLLVNFMQTADIVRLKVAMRAWSAAEIVYYMELGEGMGSNT